MAEILSCNGRWGPFLDVQFWKRAADPVLLHDPFSSLMWVLYCLPLPFLSSSDSLMSLVHLFYVLCIFQVIIWNLLQSNSFALEILVWFSIIIVSISCIAYPVYIICHLMVLSQMVLGCQVEFLKQIMEFCWSSTFKFWLLKLELNLLSQQNCLYEISALHIFRLPAYLSTNDVCLQLIIR